MKTVDPFDEIYQRICDDPMNATMRAQGYEPVYTAGPRARIVIVGQAPGVKAQATHVPWNDASGISLRKWLGVSDEQFYDPDLIALIPMDFYYPGKGAHGDLPPRPEFAPRWHPLLLALMPDVQLTILIGAYAQKYYLGAHAQSSLTETVRAHESYLPTYFPLVHPSPLNFRWRTKNPWFETDVVPVLAERVDQIISGNTKKRITSPDASSL